MKRVTGILLLFGVAAFAGCGASRPDLHGQPFKGAPAVALKELVESPDQHLKMEHTVEGKIARQCPSTGCWFFLADSGGKELKIEMGDTTPKLPQRLGQSAKVEGQLIKFGDGYEFIGHSVEFKK